MTEEVVKKKTVRSRRKKQSKPVESSTGLKIIKCHCRKCREDKSPTEFYQATDTFIDTSGYLSICRACCSEIYMGKLKVTGSIEKAILATCRILNVKYDVDAIEAAKKTSETKSAAGIDVDEGKFFGIYKSKLNAVQKSEIGKRDSTADLTFYEPTEVKYTKYEEPFDLDADIEKRWGKNLSFDDYSWLEDRLASWKATHKADTMSETTLLQEIVWKQFEIMKTRLESPDKSTSSLVKELQDLMRTAAVDPSKANIASGKSNETFGDIVKMIEENEPAEYYKDKNIFKDYDNINWYFKKYVQRPLKTFVTRSVDFNVENEDDSDIADEQDDFVDGSLVE